MRLFCAACSLVVTGCMDPAVDAPPAQTTAAAATSAPPIVSIGTALPAVTPYACGFYQWPSPATAQAKLAIATYTDTAAVLAVPLAGGPVTGFNIDADGNELFGPSKTVVPGTFTTVSANLVNDQVMVAAGNSDGLALYEADPSFLQVSQLGDLPGTMLGNSPLALALKQHVAITAGPSGVFLTVLDASLQETERSMVIPAGVLDFTAQEFGDDVLFAWSTADSCNLTRLVGLDTATRPLGCTSERIAADPAHDRALFGFADSDITGFTRFGDDGFGAAMPLTGAFAPRVAYDGARFWTSAIDVRGNVIVGVLDNADQLHLIDLPGFDPNPDSYELATFGGHAWVFAAGAQTIDAYEVCVQ